MIRSTNGRLTLNGIHQIEIKRRQSAEDSNAPYDVIDIRFSTGPTPYGNDDFTVTAFLRLEHKNLIVRKIGNDPDDRIQRVIRVPGVREVPSVFDQVIGNAAKGESDE